MGFNELQNQNTVSEVISGQSTSSPFNRDMCALQDERFSSYFKERQRNLTSFFIHL